MPDENGLDLEHAVVGTIQNRNNPQQIIAIKYLRPENAFVTSGIRAFFGIREVLIPVFMAVSDFQLMGAIVSAILERISIADDAGLEFSYAQGFSVLDRNYTLKARGESVELMYDQESFAGES
jgi:hypothetical protein